MNTNPTPQQVAALCNDTTLHEALSWLNNFNAMMGIDINPIEFTLAMRDRGFDFDTRHEFKGIADVTLDINGLVDGKVDCEVSVSMLCKLPTGFDPDKLCDDLHNGFVMLVNDTAKGNAAPGTSGTTRRRWTDEEDEMIIHFGIHEVARQTGRTLAAIYSRKVKLRKEGRLK